MFAWVRAYFFFVDDWNHNDTIIVRFQWKSPLFTCLSYCRCGSAWIPARCGPGSVCYFSPPVVLVHPFLVFCNCSVNIWLTLYAPSLIRAVVKIVEACAVIGPADVPRLRGLFHHARAWRSRENLRLGAAWIPIMAKQTDTLALRNAGFSRRLQTTGAKAHETH